MAPLCSSLGISCSGLDRNPSRTLNPKLPEPSTLNPLNPLTRHMGFHTSPDEILDWLEAAVSGFRGLGSQGSRVFGA